MNNAGMKRSMVRLGLVVLSLAVLLPVGVLSATVDTPPYKDPQRSIDERVTDLLSRMTLEEKVTQMICLWKAKNDLLDAQGKVLPDFAQTATPHGVGHIARPSDQWGRGTPGVTAGRTAADTVELVNAIQHGLLENTRLGIPAMFHEEGLHGYQARDATHFPQAIALASTWDPALIEEVYTVVAREIRARGAAHVLTPVVDVVRDPRWGRIEETYGEDPVLVSEMGLAAVRGFQGYRRLAGQPLASDRVFATLKHMTGHGQPESGTNIGPASISERVLREMFFPPFERAIKEAGAASVMASYNEIDGMPSHANQWLLGDVLRGEWSFDGIVVADYYAIRELKVRHAVADTLESAAAQALAAGVDVELPNPEVYPLLIDLVRAGKVDETVIDQAAARTLRAKFQAGLFENPYADAAYAEQITGNDEARALAVKVAEQAAILLKNDGDLLPLDPAKLRKIAVIGPNADETILGGYSDVPRQTVSLLDGVRTRVGGAAEVLFAKGVHITNSRNWFGDEVELADEAENRRLIREAVKVARKVDVVLLAVGDNEQTSREAWAEGHLGDRTRLDLVGQQEDLVQAILGTGTPTVVVLIHGRPLAVKMIAEKAPAILDAWYLGQETGTALANVLFGDVNPGGKLVVTIPRSVGQLPMFYNRKPTARRGYLFESTEPLWPFGFGLSYTSFELAPPRLDQAEIGVAGTTTVHVDVTNTGQRSGDEVVQLYIRDVFSSVTRPIKELKAFERVHLAPGETRTVSFDVGPRQLELWDYRMERVVEPGEFSLMVGANSTELQTVTLTVVDP